MRIWLVPFGELDDQRLLGQHQELHAIWGALQRGNPWGKLQPHLHGGYLHSLHDAVVREMLERHFNHHTPFPDYGMMPGVHTVKTTTETYPPKQMLAHHLPDYLRDGTEYQKRLWTDRWHLILRWGGEYKGRTPWMELRQIAREQYVVASSRYYAQGGCLHDENTEPGEGRWKGFDICLLCKSNVRLRGTDLWMHKDAVTVRTGGSSAPSDSEGAERDRGAAGTEGS